MRTNTPLTERLKQRRCLLLLLQTLPFAGEVVFYRAGGWYGYIIYPVLLFTMTFWNYHRSERIRDFLLRQLYPAVCVLISGSCSTLLYTTYISNDPLSYDLGFGFALLWAFLLGLGAIAGAIMKWLSRRMEKKTEN